MPLAVHTNVASLDARRHLGSAQGAGRRSMERLSSGYRVNSAEDDPAGVAVAEALTSQLRAQASVDRNTTNATGMSQTADASLGQIGDLLIRMREIATFAANGNLVSTDRDSLEVEFVALRDEIDRLSTATRFNDKALLAGSEKTLDFQIGIGSSTFDTLSVLFGGVSVSAFGLTATTVAGTDGSAAVRAMTDLDAALARVSSRRAALGAAQNRLSAVQGFAAQVRTNLATVASGIRDADIAEESANLARSQILVQAGTSVLAQANNQSQAALSLLGGR